MVGGRYGPSAHPGSTAGKSPVGPETDAFPVEFPVVVVVVEVVVVVVEVVASAVVVVMVVDGGEVDVVVVEVVVPGDVVVVVVFGVAVDVVSGVVVVAVVVIAGRPVSLPAAVKPWGCGGLSAAKVTLTVSPSLSSV